MNPQTITVAKASLPGGVPAWTVTSLPHLRDVVANTNIGLIKSLFADVEQDDDNAIFSFSDTLSDSDNAALLVLCQRANDFYAIFIDGGTTDVGTSDAGNFPTVTKPIGQDSATTVQLQLKDGAKANIAVDGVGATLTVKPDGYMTIDTPLPVAFDGTGQYSFTTGVELTRRGSAPVNILCGTLPARTINIAFS